MNLGDKLIAPANGKRPYVNVEVSTACARLQCAGRRAHDNLARTSCQRNIQVLSRHGLRLEHDRHIGFEPFKQKGAANGPSRNRPAHVTLTLSRLKCCSVQCTRAASGYLHCSLTAAQNFRTVYMGTRLPGECLQQTQRFGNTGISRERQSRSFDRRRRVARPTVLQDLHTLQKCGCSYACHQARGKLDYLSQRIGPCSVESSCELDELDKVDALDNRRPGCLAGQLVTPADIHRVADDEDAVLWVAPARPRRNPALLFGRGRVQLYPLHFSRRSLQFHSLAGLKKHPRI